MSDQWRRANDLFHAALERPAGDRAPFVAAQAGEDEALRDEVLSLIEAHERAGDFLESGAVASDRRSSGQVLSDGAEVGSYRIERELGRGGMGIVYVAEDTRLGRRVALKALAPSYTHDPQRRERLRKEAQAAARLSHPNIATVFALEEIGGELFIASEYVPGQTLRAELEAGTMAVARMLDISVQVARALAAAHACGIVHRDLKPENVVCGEQGSVKILDFGIARSPAIAGQPRARLTEAGMIVGTPGYMSPEQIEAQDIDFRSDIFSLGVVLYELATGVHPFEGRTAASTIGRILALDPCPPSQLRPLPAEFDRIIRKCLQKRPADRYQSTSDLALDLDQLGGGARPTPAAQEAAAIAPAGGLATGERVARLPGARWWRVHQVSIVVVYALMTGLAGVSSQWIHRDWSMALFFGCVAAAALNGTLRVHLLFTERHNRPAFRGELRRATAWMRGSDLLFGIGLLALAIPAARLHMPTAILLAAVGAGSVIASIAVEPATTDAAFPRRQSGIRRKTGASTPRNSEPKP
jgi:predicted Ser/Thr protein kinase